MFIFMTETTSNGEYMSLDEPNKYETVVLDSVDNGQANRGNKART